LKKTEYKTPELAKILKIPMRKILSYIERGYVNPTILDAAGHGSTRLWAFTDLHKIHMIRRCENLGLSVDLMRRLGKILSPPFWPDALVGNIRWLAMDEGGTAHPLYTLEEQAQFMHGAFVVISLDTIKVEVEEMLESAGLG
jgi:DNA-binding transcriptional MerR regulator